ncbi:hypothetical protein PIROE2DRAFT_11612 [Piromyces sp. E2]|nr:hypothetical protein PIROE2DRAFT_11612 [Piromyces sp. E2]|eukprot:OUM62164.1 hypothetical protein PIROE2DRAFT_11612 [Piromyces sp. E2]
MSRKIIDYSSDESDETVCIICNNGNSTKKNQIVLCDGKGCDIPVHQSAFRRTNNPEEYIHVECAFWNPNIDKYVKDKGYNVDKCIAGEHVCSICNSKEGFTIRCCSKNPTQCEK